MAEFCTCGSIIIGGHCTNKNCSMRSAEKAVASKSSAKAKSSAAKKEATAPKPAKTRRASKCITYNLYEVKKEENVT